MKAIDTALADRGLKPFQRPLQVPRLLWEGFQWSGDIFPPKELASRPGFDGQVLLAKAYQWYDENYGDQLSTNAGLGQVPVRLGNGVWRAHFPVIYGQVELFADRNLQNAGIEIGTKSAASFNVLCSIQDLPRGLADRLTDAELQEFSQFYVQTFETFIWRSGLPRADLLEMAYKDQEASTEDVLAHRYGQARWGAQQAVEKTIKGLLAIGGTAFPTRGPQAHDLNHLASLLSDAHGARIESSPLTAAACSPKVRYGEEPSTQAQALTANHAVLNVLHNLRTSSKTLELLRRATRRPP